MCIAPRKGPNSRSVTHPRIGEMSPKRHRPKKPAPKPPFWGPGSSKGPSENRGNGAWPDEPEKMSPKWAPKWCPRVPKKEKKNVFPGGLKTKPNSRGRTPNLEGPLPRTWEIFEPKTVLCGKTQGLLANFPKESPGFVEKNPFCVRKSLRKIPGVALN